jgi:hypothetical protein
MGTTSKPSMAAGGTARQVDFYATVEVAA